MKNTIKIFFLIALLFTIFLALPSISNAATQVTDEKTLKSAIQTVESGGTIEVQNNITVTGPIVIQKELTIDGNGYTLAGSTEWTSTSGNQSMFTAQFAEGKLTLKDINLNNGPKYGVQSYDGAKVILNNVSITGFRYGGVLANGGNVEIIDLHLGYNGTGANNGIEIDKGASATNNPSLTMNGTLTSDSTENVVRPAENGYLTDFTITNTENTTNKVVIAGNSVILTDENDNVVSESEIPEKATPNIDIKKLVVTIIAGDNLNRIVVDEGDTLTEELLSSSIEIDEGYEIVGFFTDSDFKNKFDFSSKISEDTIVYVKTSKIQEEKPEIPDEPVKEEEKDDVPKTGVKDYTVIYIALMMMSLTGIVYINKKNV